MVESWRGGRGVFCLSFGGEGVFGLLDCGDDRWEGLSCTIGFVGGVGGSLAGGVCDGEGKIGTGGDGRGGFAGGMLE